VLKDFFFIFTHQMKYEIRYAQPACVVCHDGNWRDGRVGGGGAKTGEILNMELS